MVVTEDFRNTQCPKEATLVLTDPPYNIGKKYNEERETTPYEYWVNEIIKWSTAPWTLILGPHPTMYDWLHKIPKPTRIIYWHRTFVLPRRGLKTWTEALTPVLVYEKQEAVWCGKTGNQRDQHDCIDAHSMMGDVQHLKKQGIFIKHPAATGTAFPSKLIPLLTKEEDLVVDPMCGCGSILVAAK